MYMCVYGAQKQAATGISTRMLSQKLQNPVIYVSPSCKPSRICTSVGQLMLAWIIDSFSLHVEAFQTKVATIMKKMPFLNREYPKP